MSKYRNVEKQKCRNIEMSKDEIVLGSKKYFARGVPLLFQIENMMNFIPNESSWKMGSKSITDHSKDETGLWN